MSAIKSVPLSSNERPLTIIAQDPAVSKSDGRVLTTQVSIPAERLADGPWGYRVQVVDYNASTKEFYAPWDYEKETEFIDPYAGKDNTDRLLADPKFHAQNAYAIAMRILGQFEFAFGRRVGWSFQSHQLKIAPHAFEDANAYYDRRSQSLQFGYFRNRNDDGNVFTCLSHDIVAHETTHAILDGLQSRYVYPSSPDQAAFHEAFSDIVALLSVFALEDVVDELLSKNGATKSKTGDALSANQVSIKAMRKSLLLGLAEQFGDEVKTVRGQPLRQSLLIKPSKSYLNSDEFQEPHRRGEILVAAVLNALLGMFDSRVKSLDAGQSGLYNRKRVVEEAAKSASHLMTIVIRALDYCAPVHLTFQGFLSALLTSDSELVGDDTAYHYRQKLLDSFKDFGIIPKAPANNDVPGAWPRCPDLAIDLNYSRSHFGNFQTDYEEVYRFLWENREALGICEDVYTRVIDVRPCLRMTPEGFPLTETVVQYVQYADVEARELWRRFQVRKPEIDGLKMKSDTRLTMHGGGALIFDQYGRLKYNIVNPVKGQEQSERIEYLWQRGFFRPKERPMMASGFSLIHRLRTLRLDSAQATSEEAWI